MAAPTHEHIPSSLPTETLPRIVVAGISHDPPGTVYQGHTLETLEINYISSGSASFGLNGKPVVYSAGHVYMYWPGDVSTGGKNDGAKGMFVCRWVKFTWPSWSKTRSSTHNDMPVPRDTLLSPEAQRDLSAAFDALLDTHDGGQPGWQMGASGYLMALIAIIVRENSRVGSNGEDGASGGAIDRRLAQACTFMEQNLTRRIKISEVAREARLAADYFPRLFQRRLGQSPLQYLIRLRIQEGRRLLVKHPGLTIREASQKAGFDDPKHFSRLFSKRYGMTPNEFRRQLASRGESVL